MPAHKKPKLPPIDAGPSAESLAVLGYTNAVGAVDMRECARLIGKSRSFAYERVREGTLDSFLHGRDRVVPLTSIALYMAWVRDHQPADASRTAPAVGCSGRSRV